MRSNYVFPYKKAIANENGKGKGQIDHWSHMGHRLALF